ncbi:MAG: N-acetylmuramic acid 6-phosphate etherase [Bacteroidetes bacterium GWA2_31_9]|nr:MAG: N-acetylmuramic acid 6-phosphate etherase [Bacteroidetes bacterium GWA2_31_9]
MQTTESESLYKNLEKLPVKKLLKFINEEDKKVPFAIENCLSDIEKVVNAIVKSLKSGGRLFYIGTGTSGRLGILDASECPPTYGVSADIVIGLIAGGDVAIKQAVEGAEDDVEAGWNDLQRFDINSKDFVIGISASGNTPYTVGAIQNCSKNGILTASITNNKKSILSKESKYSIEVIVGPEFVTGSTRMKSGTSQKMILNMISTSVMIKLGKVKGNKMIELQLKNNKLIDRAIRIISEELKIKRSEAELLLNKYGSIRKALKGFF